MDNITTPVGTVVSAALHEPDYKFAEAGQFYCYLRLSQAEAKPYMDKIQPIAEEAVRAVKKKSRWSSYLPFTDDVNENGDPNGFVIFKFSAHHKVKGGLWRPAIFDAAGHLLSAPPRITSGAKLSIAGEMYPFTLSVAGGVHLRLRAAKIIELPPDEVELPSADPASYGW